MKATDHLRAPQHTLRLTIPAREAIAAAGNQVTLAPAQQGLLTTWAVTLVQPPAGLVIVAVRNTSDTAARLQNEPEWPGEIDAPWYVRGDWQPCPTCGTALLWCEAGFVPGWRCCLNGHAVQLSADGRRAHRKPHLDVATLAATRRMQDAPPPQATT